jgi:hypothetical protein
MSSASLLHVGLLGTIIAERKRPHDRSIPH